MTRTTLTAIAAAMIALALPAIARGHVTVQPSEAPAAGFVRLDVRVPNEQDDTATTKVEVQMPPGFAEASYEPVPGWSVTVAKRKLSKPIKTDEGDTLTEELSTLTFKAAAGKGIEPGQFQDFGISVGLPDKPAGTTLTFKALQSYEGGEVVRWIGAPGSEHPAPQVTLVAGDEGVGSVHHGDAETSGAEQTAAAEDDDGGNALAITALVVGALALLVGGAALAAARRSQPA